ncbi:putative SNF2/RAD54 related DNA helicase [Trypanosoma conorhini]|uniref:Putative SNF2/RAD54 related DNA helicase n=1 Tax=Trypanosoma conorhini TaxID=83891 RepID=A0A3R7MSB9_9TRYP|nr:putative SNF2/RAD54 related DNA helicase [Trypanosoma conorhini]RNF10455.1 putative SNF2/RAD54 related DNA helicase [Trypanosoma conorhini]
MEQFLADGQRYCVNCKSWRRFKQSRFGCVFACGCPGVFVDFQKVLRDFVTDVRSGTRPVEFLPVISGRVATDRMRVAQVELDLQSNSVELRIMNTTPEDALHILKGLPLSLDQWTTTRGGCFRFPLDALDMLVHELRMVTGPSGDGLYVNAPTARCREIALASRVTSPFHLSELVPARLFSALHRHQIDGIRRALEFGGRALFADEMGVGKTLQAIGTVVALRAFPTLIVCPAALRHMWVEEVEKWLAETVELEDIHVITSSSQFLSVSDAPKVVVTSYHMASILAAQMRSRNWSCVVVDESHTLHTTPDAANDAQYTSLVCELGKRANYCLLLSGTPSLTSPFDLFNQIDTLCSGLLGQTRFDFALRYCRTDFSPHFRAYECVRNVELHSLLAATCMIRRLKSETLIDLPSKLRILLRLPETVVHGQRREAYFQKEYSLSWERKRDEIMEVVDFLLKKYTKVVLFAHHIKLLDALTTHVGTRKVSWIRIDGGTPMSARATSLSWFNQGDTRVAIIGITACAVGIQLTGASCALFAELPPDATWMQQAEDRLHRPGQMRQVVFFYIVGANSFFDGNLFARLCRSFQTVRRTTDGVPASLTASYAGYTETFGDVTEANLAVVKNATASFNLATAAPLLFRISPNTGRIHVRHGGRYLLSLSLDEAQQHWPLTDDFSQELRQFILNVESLSFFERRRLRLAAAWLPSNFSWRGVKARRKTFLRYTREAPVLGRVFFWKVNRCSYPSSFYAALLCASGEAYVPLCLECEGLFACPFSPSPGEVVCIEKDIDMFCSGRCRAAFYIKRSGSAVRRSVREADNGICSHCHVDCEVLCALLAAATTGRERESILDRMHPHMRQYPALFNRIIENPVAGNVWNADHVLPVSQGGGQATMENLQTLCVACHAEKTMRESSMRRRDAVRRGYRTTVDLASAHFTVKSPRRVTAERLLLLKEEAPYFVFSLSGVAFLGCFSGFPSCSTGRGRLRFPFY